MKLYQRLVKQGIISKEVLMKDVRKLISNIKKYKADSDYKKIQERGKYYEQKNS
jgi:hypothetical protein